MNKKVIIIGASGHASVIADIIIANGDNVIGFLDDDINKDTIGKICDWEKYKDKEFVIGIGKNEIREKISRFMSDAKWYTAIHPSAVVSQKSIIEEGTVVMPNAVINSGAVVGKHCIINSAAVVEHDNKIDDYCHISVGAKLGGSVSIGRMTMIGMGAMVRNNLSVCCDCIIGVGAVVVKSILENGTYIGIPARKLR